MRLAEPMAGEVLPKASDTATLIGGVRESDPDAALVNRLRRNEPGAAEALVAAYGDRIYRLAVRIMGNHADAEEVVQDALWSAIRKVDGFRGAAAFGSWIYRITANAAYQKRRGQRMERSAVPWEDVAPTFDDAGEHVHPGFDWSPQLKDPAIQAELLSVLSAAVDELPPNQRTAFFLHDVEGLSNPQIADTLQVELPAVKSRVHRARLHLRRRLAETIGAETVVR